jgi:hypothetical protein
MKVLRYEVPVDDHWHTIDLPTDPLHVAAREPWKVEIWALDLEDGITRPRTFRVFGTGHAIPASNARRIAYVGTALVPPAGDLVWHLFEDTLL